MEEHQIDNIENEIKEEIYPWIDVIKEEEIHLVDVFECEVSILERISKYSPEELENAEGTHSYDDLSSFGHSGPLLEKDENEPSPEESTSDGQEEINQEPMDEGEEKGRILHDLANKMSSIKINVIDGQIFLVCMVCTYRTNMSWIMRQHLSQHSEPNTDCKMRRCHMCGSEKPQAECYKCVYTGHPSDSRARKKPYRCTECNTSYTHSYQLRQHMSNHVGQKRYRCGSCRFSATTALTLKKHRPECPRTAFSCTVCPFFCESDITLHKHMEGHSGEPYRCDKCKFRTTNKYKLSAHLRWKHGPKSHSCAYCVYRARTSADVFKHVCSEHKSLRV